MVSVTTARSGRSVSIDPHRVGMSTHFHRSRARSSAPTPARLGMLQGLLVRRERLLGGLGHPAGVADRLGGERPLEVAGRERLRQSGLAQREAVGVHGAGVGGGREQQPHGIGAGLVGPQAGGGGVVVCERLPAHHRVALERARERQMQPRPLGAGDALVGDVADQGVLEDLGAARLGVDQPALGQAAQGAAEVGAARERRQLGLREAAADHRGPLQHLLGVGREQVDPGRDHALHRLGHAVAALARHRQDLLQEERVAAGQGDLAVLLAAERGREPAHVLAGERRERHRRLVAHARPPARMLHQELVAGEADHHERHARVGADDRRHELEQGRLRPVGVLDHEQGRLALRHREQQLPPGVAAALRVALELVGLAIGPAPVGHGAQELVDPLAGRVGDERVQVAHDPGDGLVGRVLGAHRRGPQEHVAKRHVRARLAVGQAPAHPDGRRLVRAAQLDHELLEQAALADPRLAHDRDQVRPRVLDRALDQRAQEGQLGVAADERAVRAPAAAIRPHRRHPLDGVGRDRARPALDPQRARRDGARERLDRPEGALADQDLARLGGLLQARGQVDRLAGDQEVAAGARAGHDQPGVDPDPQVHPHVAPLGQAGQARAHHDGRPHRPLGIVLVRGRDAEHGHHRVADELLDGAAVGLGRPRELVVEVAQETAQRLGVHAGRKLGRSGQIGEEDGGELALGRVADPQRAAAAGAEAGALGWDGAAVGATGGRHRCAR